MGGRLFGFTHIDKDDRMNNKKVRIGKIYHTSIWIIIIFLFSYMVMKTCFVYSNIYNKTAAEYGKDIAANFTNHLIWSSSPFLRYTKNVGEEKKESAFTKLINSIFPVNQYAEYAWAEQNGEGTLEDGELYPVLNLDISKENDETSQGDSGDVTISREFENDISFIHGETYIEDTPIIEEESQEVMASNLSKINKLISEKQPEFLISNFYIVDSTTKISEKLFDPSELLKKDMRLKQDNSKPQILIYHTHSQESFIDSKKGVQGDTVVGVGDYLTDLLTNQYGYNVIHDTGCYDLVHGKLDRSKAYSYSLDSVEKILKNNPSIEIIIDLHRDGVGDDSKRVTNVNGKDTAQIMFFNGLSRNRDGPISYLNNPNISHNLAFSLQLHLESMKMYPNLTKKIYLKSYRYNLHLKPKSLLIELGNQNSTLSEAKNAMEPLAEILNKVLTGN